MVCGSYRQPAGESTSNASVSSSRPAGGQAAAQTSAEPAPAPCHICTTRWRTRSTGPRVYSFDRGQEQLHLGSHPGPSAGRAVATLRRRGS